MIIGRRQEIKTLQTAYNSKRSEFIAVYGRRRVGKTFLIKEVFDDSFTFTHTGIAKAAKTTQLKGFQASLKKSGVNVENPEHGLTLFLCWKSGLQIRPNEWERVPERGRGNEPIRQNKRQSARIAMRT